jgi:hypothetical protein
MLRVQTDLQEGMNVGRIRKDLATAGHLIKSIPLVTGSTVRFAFLVASSYPITSKPVSLPRLGSFTSRVERSDQQEVAAPYSI